MTAFNWLACAIARKGPWQVFVDFPWLVDKDVPGGCVEACVRFNATTVVDFPPVPGDQWAYQYD